MTFGFPLGLLGLLSVPAILALHFFSRRARTTVVSDVRLWNFTEVEVRGSKFQPVPPNLLMVVDIGIAILLSLALSQPQMDLRLPRRDAHHVVILLDDSTSMQSTDLFPNRFYHARLEATNLLTNLGPRDIATVFTFGTSVERIGDSRDVNFAELLRRVAELQAGGTGQALEEALALATESLVENIPSEIHILTDSSFLFPDVGALTSPPETHVYGNSGENAAVLDMDALRLNQEEIQVFARFANFGDRVANRLATLLADGNPIDSFSLAIPGQSEVTETWTVTGSARVLSVDLVGEDLLEDDDKATIGSIDGASINIGVVGPRAAPIERALQALENVDYRFVAPEEYLSGLVFDLTIFNGYLPQEWPSGRVFVINPPSESNIMELSGPAEISQPPLALDDELLEGIDYTGVRWGRTWSLDTLPLDYEPVLQAGDTPLILRWNDGSSQIVLFLPLLDEGNITRHPSFPILMANLAREARGSAEANQVSVGQVIELPGYESYPLMRIEMPDGETVEFERDRPVEWRRTRIPGPYKLEMTDRDGEIETRFVGVNAGSKEESSILPRDWHILEGAPDIPRDSTVEGAFNLAPWLLAVAAALLLGEAGLAWR